MDNFLDSYLDYSKGTEVPIFFNRWCCLSGVGALLGRNYSTPFLGKQLYGNLYMMLIGSPGTRKNTAINMIRDLLILSGYNTLAADKTTKEKFLMDMAGMDGEEEIAAAHPGRSRGKPASRLTAADLNEFMNSNLWGEGDNNAASKGPSEVYIVAPEFNDFLGNGNIEFISLLGNLWDFNGIYKSRIKNGKSIAVNDPTISIAGGNTPTGFSLAFPTEIFGQGFFSRLLLVYGEPTGKKIAFPPKKSPEETKEIVELLGRIKKTAVGEARMLPTAELLLEKIYNTWITISDVRFEHYANRRFTHLLKLCTIISAAHYTNEISERHVVVANTILSHTENLMPKALGEFGKAKNSDIAHKLMQVLEASDPVPMSFPDIWGHLSTDLEKMNQLSDMITSLQAAKKITFVNGYNGVKGYVIVRKAKDYSDNDMVDWSILTMEERNLS